MLILAIDTADKITGIALFQDSSIIGERTLLSVRGRETTLSLMVKELLRDCGFDFKELTGIAINSGPGSFTGLRVGSAYAKGLCFRLQIPLIAVDSLEALAHSAGFCERLIIPLVYAKGEEVYYAGFKFIEKKLSRIWADEIINFRKLFEKISQPYLLLGSGYLKHKMEFDALAPEIAVGQGDGGISSTARSVAILGAKLLFQGKMVEVNKFEPKYLHDFASTC
jgi:tRNA threonylcarbamoyladenosine biosynthesis protein TsaB